MGKHADTVQYTIRGVPREVDRLLRQKAERRNLSLNQVVLQELTLATSGLERIEDFSDLVGKWTPDPGFDEILASGRQIDWEKWK